MCVALQHVTMRLCALHAWLLCVCVCRITRADLAAALMRALSSSPFLVKWALPLIIEKLSSTYRCGVLGACAAVHCVCCGVRASACVRVTLCCVCRVHTGPLRRMPWPHSVRVVNHVAKTRYLVTYQRWV